jgi:uncharacterized membrane protein
MSDDRPRRDNNDDEELGSLAQSARRSSLKQARIILIIIGVLTLALNLVLFFNAEKEVRQALEQEKQKAGPGVVFDPIQLKEAEEQILNVVKLVYGGTAALGVVFIVLGIAVYAAPVPCTVTGLVLYVAGIAVFAVINPANLLSGLVVKIIIIIGLVKAVQAAAAYERERKAERQARQRDRDESEAEAVSDDDLR